jgi:arylformamidase
VTPEEVERGYNNRAAVPDHPHWFAEFRRRSDAAYAGHRHERDVRYGGRPRQTLDLFLPESKPRGTLVFIHGGYWRALDKSDHAFVAPPFLARGIAVATLNYDLCPSVSISDIVDETREAIAFIARQHAARAPRPIIVSGHSAGGHLAAMMLATDWSRHGFAENPVDGAMSLSGVHDLAPLVHFSYNVDLKLTHDEARRLSPVNMTPTTQAPLLVAVGADETSEFLRQSDLIVDAWPRNRPGSLASPMRIVDRHHFNVVLELGEAESALTRATLVLF